MAESGFLVRVPEAESVVQDLRERFDPSAVLGVPAHVTVLFPFMSPDLVTPEVLRRAAASLRSVNSFNFALRNIGRWPETTYLKPEPAAPFVHLTRTLFTEFPECPPYGGAFPDIVPHLSVADRSHEAADSAELELRLRLDGRSAITGVCSAVELWENSSGRWKSLHTIKLSRP